MHLLYLGATNWIFNKILFQPGMLDKRRPTDEDPVGRYNVCLSRMWLPKNFSRLPPKVSYYYLLLLLYSCFCPLAWSDEHSY